MKALYPFRLFGVIALVAFCSTAAVAAMPDAKLEEVSAKKVQQFKASYMGYPVNQDIQLAAFYDWYTKSGLTSLMLNNAGDPFNPHGNLGELGIEREVIEHFAPLYGFDKKDVWGIVTMSGTDGNNHGIYFGYKLLERATGLKPILYVSTESHYSNKRLADLQNIEFKLIETDRMGAMLPSALKAALDSTRPALVVYSMGTTFKGGIDDMAELNMIVDKAKCPAVYRHVDAALFGGYLPYTSGKKLVNAKAQHFDSIAVSGHKFFGIDEPCGLFLTTKEVLKKQAPFNITYLDSSMPMINCSRSTLSPLKFYWIINTVGTKGFTVQTQKMMEMTQYLKKSLDKLGWPAWLGKHSNTVFFKRPSEAVMNKYILAPDVDARFGGDLAHVVVMQHIDKAMIDSFILDLRSEQK